MPAVAGQRAGEGGDHAGVELGAGAAGEFLEGGADGPGAAVGAGGGHRVEGVGDGDDPCALGDLGPRQPVRVAAAVEPFVVVEDGGAGLLQEADAAGHLVSVLGVQFDGPALRRGQRPVLAEDPGGDADLPDVVQDAREADDLDPFVVHAEFAGDHDRGLADPLAVAAGVAVLEVDGPHQRADRGAVGGALLVGLGEHPPGGVHRQQHQQGGGRAVRGAPEDRHHHPGQPVHRHRWQRGDELAPPGGTRGHPVGEDPHPAVQQRGGQAEHGDGDGGGEQRPRQVGGDHGVPAAEHPVRPGGGVHGQAQGGGPPDAAQRPRRVGDRGEEGARHGDQGGGGRREQEGGGEQHRVEGVDPGPAPRQPAGRVDRGEQEQRPPRRAQVREGRETGARGDDGGGRADARSGRNGCRRNRPHGVPSPGPDRGGPGRACSVPEGRAAERGTGSLIGESAGL